MAVHRLILARAEHKFAVAHMTVFADGTKERLHGHNYTVEVAVEVERIELDAMLPFAPVKEAICGTCARQLEGARVHARLPRFARSSRSAADRR